MIHYSKEKCESKKSIFNQLSYDISVPNVRSAH